MRILLSGLNVAFLLHTLVLFLAAERHKRLTCQLGTVSIGGNSIGNFGCYLHCKWLNYNGGYCNSQSVCTCTN